MVVVLVLVVVFVVLVVVLVFVVVALLFVARVVAAAVVELLVEGFVGVGLVDDFDDAEVGVVERVGELLDLAAGLDKFGGTLRADVVLLLEFGGKGNVTFLEGDEGG